MKEYSVWKDEEVISLFNMVAEFRNKNESLLVAFEKYAQQTQRKRNSVRNYYYTELKELKENTKRCEKLNIDISKHIVTSPKNFSDLEIENFVLKILELCSKGHSVRKACLILSNGDITEMVRLQNKYRNVLISNQELVENCINKLKNKGIIAKNPLKNEEKQKDSVKNNIISMPKSNKSKLSDNEITSLFLGLVKLVKRCAKEEAEESLKNELTERATNLRKSFVKISGLEVENQKLNKEINYKKIENQKLITEVKLLKSEVASLINNATDEKTISEKYDNFSNYVKSLKKKKQEEVPLAKKS